MIFASPRLLIPYGAKPNGPRDGVLYLFLLSFLMDSGITHPRTKHLFFVQLSFLTLVLCVQRLFPLILHPFLFVSSLPSLWLNFLMSCERLRTRQLREYPTSPTVLSNGPFLLYHHTFFIFSTPPFVYPLSPPLSNLPLFVSFPNLKRLTTHSRAHTDPLP